MNNPQDSFVSVYSDARSEYTKQLCLFLTPTYFKWFITLLEKARETTANEPRKLLWQFQTYLNDIPEWNMEKLNMEIHTIQELIKCDYLEDLLTAVFIAHTKVLTAIRLTSKHKRIQITVPKIEHFLFKVLCESAKLLWGSSYLFNENISNIEKQKNYRQIESLIVDGIHQAIRQLVPVKSILKDFVNQEDAEDDTETENDTIEPDSKDVKETKSNVSEKGIPTGISSSTPAPDTIDAPFTVESNAVENAVENVPDGRKETITEQKTSSGADNQSNNPIINITDNPKEVSFTNYVTVFSPSNPDNSEIIRDISDTASDDGTGSLSLDFLDDIPQGLDSNEIEDLDEKNVPMNSDDYEVLS